VIGDDLHAGLDDHERRRRLEADDGQRSLNLNLDLREKCQSKECCHGAADYTARAKIHGGIVQCGAETSYSAATRQIAREPRVCPRMTFIAFYRW
jgi:hypothetical protein